jgi:hypothetical protein
LNVEQKQTEGIAVGGNRARADVLLIHEPLAKKSLEQ